jgi:DNA-binding Lrp family transcriptional regulator
MTGEPFSSADEAERRARESWGLDEEESDTPQDTVTPVSLDDSYSDLQEQVQSDTSDTSDSGSRALAVPRTSWTAAELMATSFPEPRWAVPGLIAEGVSVFAGPPKVGKSWLMLGVGLAVATGGKALSRVDVESGPVLYLALEDTPRRLKARLSTMLRTDPAPDTLTLATTCPPLSQGGDERIGLWLKQHPDARLVVVDVFARIRGTTPAGVSAYDADYTAVARAKTVADAHGVAMVLVHHVRKAEAADFLEAVSGTNGLAGAADSVLVLKRSRGEADAVLHLTGRDVEEAEHAMKFTAAFGTWELLAGPALDYTLGETRAAILRYLREHGPTRPKQIAEALDMEPSTVRQTCPRMVQDGQLDTDGAGLYFPPVTPVTPVTLAGQGAIEGVTDLSLAVTEEDEDE